MLSRTPAPEALFVRLPGLAEVSRRWFGGYVAHDLEGVSGERVGRSAQVVADYYRHVDDALAELWARRRGPRLLVLVSPHGAAAPGPWRRAALLGRQPVEGVLTGRADGVLLLHGEGVRAGAFVADATVEDVVPTLLYALGLPLARDLDGRALTAAFDPGFLATHPLRFVASYERLSR
jgi:arylsulfatase A-like enzyme